MAILLGVFFAVSLAVPSQVSSQTLSAWQEQLSIQDGPRAFGVGYSLPGYLAPSPRSDHDMAYDAESDRIILFGGWEGSSSLGDTWAFDDNANEWTAMNPGTSPVPRGLHAMAYDAESDRVILYSGVPTSDLIPTGETWAYDFNTDTWTDMDPATKPPARWGRMAYDAESDRVVLFGGAVGHIVEGGTIYNDTWAYDFNNNSWTEMSPRPSRATSHAMAYDTESDLIVVYGGERASGGIHAEGTWVYDLNNDTWLDTNPSLEPPLGRHIGTAYDSMADRVIFWGGRSPTVGSIADIWSYDANANTWETMSVAAGPSARELHRMAYDAESGETVMFGGRSLVAGFNNETWAFGQGANVWTPLSPLTLPQAPRDLEAAAAEGEINLLWKVPLFNGGYPVTNYRIYRGTTLDDIPFLKEISSSLTYVDPTPSVGTEYYYHVTAVTFAGEGPPSNADSAMLVDDVPPTVTISSPRDGEVVESSPTTVSGTAVDNLVVDLVEVSLDGTTWDPATLTGASWSVSLTLEEGSTTIRARAIDNAGNVGTASVIVTCSCPPAGSGPDLVPIAIAAGLAGAATLAVVLFLVRRRRSR
ncbi:MAG: kelch repeat-containing protein [Thermoplasmata archaeon]